jgi:hypothetical protein
MIIEVMNQEFVFHMNSHIVSWNEKTVYFFKIFPVDLLSRSEDQCLAVDDMAVEDYCEEEGLICMTESMNKTCCKTMNTHRTG